MDCFFLKDLKLSSLNSPLQSCAFFSSGKNLKEGLLVLEEDLLQLTDELQQEAQCIPNMTHPDVPIGGEDCSTLRKMVSLSPFMCVYVGVPVSH